MTFKVASAVLVSGIGLFYLILHGLPNTKTVDGSPKLDIETTAVIKRDNSFTAVSVLGKLAVELSNNRLSLATNNQPLHAVAKAIAHKAKINIVLDKAVPNPNVAIAFSDLPISAGLQQLFESYDTFFFFSNTSDAKAKLATVWVYPKAKGEQYSPNPQNDVTLCPDRLDATNNPDAKQRAEALANTIQRNGPEAEAVLQTALDDSEQDVRINALQAATIIGLSISPDKLKELALYDPSETIRSMAIAYFLQQFTEGRIASSDVSDIANSALNDPAPVVADTAKQILASFDEAAYGRANTNQTVADDPQLVVSP